MSMITYPDAIELVQAAANSRPLPGESVILRNAVGRFLSEDIYAREDLPAQDNSAMDGFAFKSALSSAASSEQPLLLPVLGYIAAGDSLPLNRPAHEGVYGVMTGGLIPDGGFDSVVKVEDVETLFAGGRSFVRIKAPVPPGNNIRPRGSDFSNGSLILKKGHRICHEDVMALAALGYAAVPVFKKVKVGVLSTGKEVVPVTTANLSPQQVRNSTALYLHSYFGGLGCEVRVFEQSEDSPQGFEEKFTELLEMGCDLILTTGGVSMGNWDYVTESLPKLGVNVKFHKVAIRPGKPILFGVHETTGVAVFGLPGNPVSTAVGANFFVTPYLKAQRRETPVTTLRLSAMNTCKKSSGIRFFLKGRILIENGNTRVEILSGQGSYMLHSLLTANCWVVGTEDDDRIETGMQVEVYPWEGRIP